MNFSPSAAFGAVLILAGLAPCAPVLAQDEVDSSKISFSAGVDYTNDYFFRGIVQEDDAFILQPWAEISLSLIEDEDASLSLALGTWNSFHDSATGATTTDEFVEDWYESDFYATLGLESGAFSFGLTYTLYSSPSSAFSSIDEVAFSVAFDDSEHLGAWAMNPSVTVAIEVGDDAADGAEQGVYLELAIAPGFTVEQSPFGTVEVSVPLTVGLSLDDYYEDPVTSNDETFGYFDVGLEAGFALPMPSGYGAWSLNSGVHLLLLGDSTETFNSKGDDLEVTFTVGVSVAF